MRDLKRLVLSLGVGLSLLTVFGGVHAKDKSDASSTSDNTPEIFLGINTADVREDTSSVQFLNLFRTAIPFNETVPWGSSKGLEYDENGWPTKLNGGKAGTKFLNRLPENTVEDGFFTVLYDGEGEIFYGNDARLVVHRPNKDIIEIRAGKDKILNASLFIQKSNPDNYVRNIRILPEGGVCKGTPHIRVKSPADCHSEEAYLSFEDHHFNPWASEQLAAQKKKEEKEALETEAKMVDADKSGGTKKALEADSDDKNTLSNKNDVKESTVKKSNVEQDKNKDDKVAEKNTDEKANKEASKNKDVAESNVKTTLDKSSKESTETITDNDKKEVTNALIKGEADLSKALVFNPDYLDFMKDFQMVRFMNMSGMTRNPVTKWSERNTLKKATWGGKYSSRGAPVEIMVTLSNRLNAYPWFSMPYKASDDYIKQFGEYVNEYLKPDLKTYIEYSNEVWNPIFTHHDHAIAEGMKQKLDKKKSQAGYKWYSKRSVETFKLWEKVFGGTDRLIRVMGSWASNQIMSSTVLKYEDAYKNTDAIAIGPYFSAHPRVLRRAKTVDDVFKFMLDKKTKWGMESTVNYIKKQAKVAKSYGVDLVAYEGGQHLVDWNTRKADEHPNPLLYAANRDPRMGILYDELMREWNRAGGKLFVAFSAPRIYSWYGSWGVKEHIRQARSDAPKYDSLLRYLSSRLYPKHLPQPGINPDDLTDMSGEVKNIKIGYAKTPQMIWDMSRQQQIKTQLKENSPRDIDAHWQANWDSKNLYLSVAISDDYIQQGDEIKLTLDTTTEAQDLEKKKAQEKLDIENEKALLEKQRKEKAARKLEYERIARERKEKAEEKKRVEALAKKEKEKEKEKGEIAKVNAEETSNKETAANIKKAEEKPAEVKKAGDPLADGVEKKAQSLKQVETAKENKKEEKSVKLTFNKADNKTDSVELVKSKTEAKDQGKESVEKNVSQVSEKKSDESSVDKMTVEIKKEAEISKTKAEEGKAVVIDIEKEQPPKKEEGLNKSFNDNVITFTFTPFDGLNKQSRITLSDSGYLVNVSIPWSEIYYNKDRTDIQMKSGDRLGINLIVKDFDQSEKGNKELSSANTNLPLPKMVLKNTLFDSQK